MDDQQRGVARSYQAALFIVLATAFSGCQHTVVTAAPPAPKAKSATFNRDVAPILFANCSPCHHAGDAAPFSLLTFEDARKRYKQIVDVTRRRFMQPWPRERRH